MGTYLDVRHGPDELRINFLSGLSWLTGSKGEGQVSCVRRRGLNRSLTPPRLGRISLSWWAMQPTAVGYLSKLHELYPVTEVSWIFARSRTSPVTSSGLRLGSMICRRIDVRGNSSRFVDPH